MYRSINGKLEKNKIKHFYKLNTMRLHGADCVYKVQMYAVMQCKLHILNETMVFGFRSASHVTLDTLHS